MDENEENQQIFMFIKVSMVHSVLTAESKIFLLCLQIRIWAQKTAIDQGQGNYALNVTGPILNFLQLYYNISYPLDKSGVVAFIICADLIIFVTQHC